MSAPPEFLENFYHEYMLNFVICFFCIYWYNHMMFTLRFVEVGYYVDWFDEPSLFPWNKSHVITLVCCWVQFDNILLRILKSIWFDTGVATWFWGVVVVWCYFCCPCCYLLSFARKCISIPSLSACMCLGLKWVCARQHMDECCFLSILLPYVFWLEHFSRLYLK